ncbi:DNA polymerase I [Caballeronia zhejiangensis]|uniref:DNA polymerase I n=1 Tax=Caballeronia zhejiangensis TaxID=871203 RepID=UPI00158BC80E|nr:DNA polymerase I [Caballeronia zhejiangensis]
MKLWLDLETFSPTPIRNGTHIYAEPAEIMLVTYAVDDGEVYEWDRTTGAPMPLDLDEALDDADEYWWQNGNMFDYTLLRHTAPELLARMPLERWRDTLLQAYAHSLPGKLDLLCQIFKLPMDQAKDKRGGQLIQRFCKPQRDGSRATRETHPAEWAEFIEYAKSDIRAMRAVHKKMPKWNYPNNKSELALSHLDVRINQRGMQMDVDLARAAVRAIDRAQKDLAARTVALTDGEVAKATQRDKLLQHLLAEYDIDLPDLKKSTLERRINDPDLPDPLRELLAIRLEATMTSSSKYKTLLRGVSHDGRLRGLQQFLGANRTGRVAHRLYQPGNMPRPNVGLMAQELGVKKLGDGDMQRYISMGIDALKTDCADLLFENVMGLTSNVVRGSIIAPEGKKLVISDLSNIEGRVLAFLAGEQWKLDAFRDYDKGIGWDLYVLAYATAFGVDPKVVDKIMRNLGKPIELASGFGGGVGAFITFALVYGIDLDAMARAAGPTLAADLLREAAEFLAWTKKQKRSTFGLSDETFTVIDAIKRGWRKGHPMTCALWSDLEDAARNAIASPGAAFKAGPQIVVRCDGAWLRVQLPSKRQLCYVSPRISESGEISYMGVNQYTRKWQRVKTYGGKLAENATQAVARDILFGNMPAVEAAGYSIVLSIHDELLTEAPDREEYSERRLSELISTVPDWAQGIPLSAGGFEATRYRKD